MKYSLFLLAAASLWCAEESSRVIEKTFPLTGNKRTVSVCGINGAIKVAAADGNEVRFSIREELSAPTRELLAEMKQQTDVVFLQEPGSVLAGVKGPWSDTPCGQPRKEGSENRRRWEGKDTRVRHDFTVSVPRDANLQLRTVNGGIEVTATAGPYSIHTVNGSIRMTDVEGAGDVNTVNGTVVATYKKNPSADTKYRTVNGKLDLYYQPSLSADFYVKTVNGKAFTDFDMTAIASAGSPEAKGMKVIHRRGNSGQLRAGSGGPKISAETVNGSILIHDVTKGRP